MTQPFFDPAEALAAAQRARSEAAVRGTDTPWYAPVYGLGIGTVIASLALPSPWLLLGLAAGLALLATNMAVWKHRAGLSVINFQGPRTTKVAVVWTVVYVLLALAGFEGRHRLGYDWAPLACGAVAAVLATLASRLWDRAWRAETRAA